VSSTLNLEETHFDGVAAGAAAVNNERRPVVRDSVCAWIHSAFAAFV
jgi:hypothetical protein